MKKIIYTIGFILAFSNLTMANNKDVENKKNVKTNCGRVAAIMCEIYEETNDCCMDSSDFNELYSYFYDKCVIAC